MEKTTAKVSKLHERGVWHFEPYSQSISDAMAQIETSPFSVLRLSELLATPAVRGFATSRTSSTEGIPFLTPRDVTLDGISFDEVRYITVEEHRKLERSQIQRGDVLVRLVLHPGIAAVYKPDAPANISSHVARLRLSPEVDPAYLTCYLNSYTGQALVRSLAIGNVQPVLTISILLKLPVVLPPLTEQRRIVKRVMELAQEAKELEMTAEERRTEARVTFDTFLKGEAHGWRYVT